VRVGRQRDGFCSRSLKEEESGAKGNSQMNKYPSSRPCSKCQKSCCVVVVEGCVEVNVELCGNPCEVRIEFEDGEVRSTRDTKETYSSFLKLQRKIEKSRRLWSKQVGRVEDVVVEC